MEEAFILYRAMGRTRDSASRGLFREMEGGSNGSAAMGLGEISRGVDRTVTWGG